MVILLYVVMALVCLGAAVASYVQDTRERREDYRKILRLQSRLIAERKYNQIAREG